MHIDGLNDAEIRDILLRTRRVAVVGASANPARPSFGVMGFLLRAGYDVTPVNPGLAGQQIQQCRVAADLDEASRRAPLDMVDIFRAPEHVGPVVEAAIRLGARSIWMQLGVINEPAASLARSAGLRVVMDRCPAIEWPRLHLVAGVLDDGIGERHI